MVDTMKKLAAAFAAACALCLALAGTAWAAGASVTLEPVDGEDAVGVSLDGLQGASALRLTLEAAGAEFDLVLDAPVAEVRYRGDRINVYVAGAAGLLDGEVKLGQVRASGDGDAPVTVKVTALSTVDAGHAEESVGFDPVEAVVRGPATPPGPPSGGEEEGGQPGTEEDKPDVGDPDVDPSANRSPGAPSGTDQSLEPTGDVLVGPATAFAAAALCAGAALVLARRKEQTP